MVKDAAHPGENAGKKRRTPNALDLGKKSLYQKYQERSPMKGQIR